MEERTKLYAAGDQAGIDALEQQLLAQNAEHKDWACTEEMMKLHAVTARRCTCTACPPTSPA